MPGKKMQRNTTNRYAINAAIVSTIALLAQAPPVSSAPAHSTSKGNSCCSSTSAVSQAVLDEDFTYDLPEEGCDPLRFHQARYLIEANREFIRKAKPLHEKMQEQILIAKTLKGEANMLLNRVPAVAPPKLQGAALQAAMGEYSRSLQAFVNNTDRYKANLNNFQLTIGDCQRAQQTYNAQRQQYGLHCDQFHVQGLTMVEPPHICGALNLTAGEASQISGLLRADEQRLQKTMGDLNTAGALVAESRNLVAANLSNTAHDSIRQREEEKLAKQFGRLKEEYEMLKIQNKMLTPDKQKQAAKMIHRSVSGNVVAK